MKFYNIKPNNKGIIKVPKWVIASLVEKIINEIHQTTQLYTSSGNRDNCKVLAQLEKPILQAIEESCFEEMD